MANQQATATLTLKIQPEKKDRAWFLTFEDDTKDWFPFSTIIEFNPHTLQVKIQTWILKQKNIKFKV